MIDFNKFNHTNWTNQYYSNEYVWLNESLNCGKISNNLVNDWSFISFFNNSFFSNAHFLLDSKSNISLLDVILMWSSNNNSYSSETADSSRLYYYFIIDIFSSFNTFFFDMLFILRNNISDISSPIIISNPELVLAIQDYAVLCFSENNMYYSVNSMFGSYISNLNLTFYTNSYITYLAFYLIFTWVFVIFFLGTSTTIWRNLSNPTITRLTQYLISFSAETRIQFESVIATVLFFLGYWVMTLMTFDDDQEEVIETINSCFFYFFTIVVSYLGYKYSIHYFAFLEASVAEGRTVGFIAKQFFKDFLNTFSLLLRFYILLFRINVYDTLEDFFDSYYIFVGDFDDDEYLNETFISLYGNMFFTSDNNDDRYVGLEDENSIFYDLFFIYFIAWGKLFYFIFFMAEEGGRLALALYICYLIIFEVHSVNCSYKESNYIISKR